MSKVVLFGTGGGASLASRYISEAGQHEIVGYTVDGAYLTAAEHNGLPVEGFETLPSRWPPSEYDLFIPLGYQQMNGLRAGKFQQAKDMGYSMISYVHPSNHLPAETVIGENSLVMAGQVVGRDVQIGENVVMWGGCHIGDQTVVGDHVWFAAHVCVNGRVVVEDRAFLASNCTISTDVVIGERTLVGANALVTTNTKPGTTIVVEPTSDLGFDSERFMATW